MERKQDASRDHTPVLNLYIRMTSLGVQLAAPQHPEQ